MNRTYEINSKHNETNLNILFIGFAGYEVMEDFPHILFPVQFPSIHGETFVFCALTFQEEDVMVADITKCRSTGVTPSAVRKLFPLY